MSRSGSDAGRLLIRADANEQIGVGHVSRCLALAAGWMRTYGSATVAMVDPPSRVAEWLRTYGVAVWPLDGPAASSHDLQQVLEVAGHLEPAAIVVDGYAFGPGYSGALRALAPVLIVDDEGKLDHYDADVVLNQNLHAAVEVYRHRAPGATLLLGTTFALLRPEFLEWEKWDRPFSRRARTCVVTFGGSDQDNVTGGLVETITRLDLGLATRVIAGPANPNLESLRRAADGGGFELVIDARDMAAQFAWADVAAAAAGSTCWELAFMGLPSVVIPLAPNQQPLAEALDEVGAAVAASVGTATDRLCALVADEDRRRECSRRGRRLVDGKGAQRVVDALRAVTR